MPHPIRLRGPWEYVALREGTSPPLPAGKTAAPGAWANLVEVGFRGEIVFRRRFHKPTGLTDDSTVALVVEGLAIEAEIWLNQSRLGELERGDSPGEYEIGPLLAAENLLEIRLHLPLEPQSGSPLATGQSSERAGETPGEVRLEIYDC